MKFLGLKKNWKQWLSLLCLCIGGGTIYKLPYIRDVFYVQFQHEKSPFSTKCVGAKRSFPQLKDGLRKFSAAPALKAPETPFQTGRL